MKWQLHNECMFMFIIVFFRPFQLPLHEIAVTQKMYVYLYQNHFLTFLITHAWNCSYTVNICLTPSESSSGFSNYPFMKLQLHNEWMSISIRINFRPIHLPIDNIAVTQWKYVHLHQNLWQTFLITYTWNCTYTKNVCLSPSESSRDLFNYF